MTDAEADSSCWAISETDALPADPDVRATIFTIGNGRICTRGTLFEEGLGTFRGVYVSGLHTRSPLGLMYTMGAPDWLPVRILVEGQTPAISGSRRALNMRNGSMERVVSMEHGETRLQVRETRFAAFDCANRMAQRVELEVVAGKGVVSVSMGIDADIRQSRAKYYTADQFPACDQHGLRLSQPETVSVENGELQAVLLSRQTGRRSAARARVAQTSGPAAPPAFSVEGALASATWSLPASDPGTVFVFEKICAIGGDVMDFEEAVPAVERAMADWGTMTFDKAFERHCRVLHTFWNDADVLIEGDEAAQRAVRFAVWSTRIAAVRDDGASSMAAKNLTGDWYRGAVFWDMEVFQLPMLAATAPELARNHVRYRTRRLNAARRLAAQDGYRGARFAGQSYDTGLEDPPCLGGLGLLEIHVSFEVAWGMRHYYYMTGDTDFLLAHGLEVVLSVADFWADKVTRDAEGLYHLRPICGPDELHKPVDDNAYTNAMVRELLEESLRWIASLRIDHADRVEAILGRCSLDEARFAHWQDVAQNMFIPRIDDHTLDQFAGHHALPEPNRRLLKEKGMGADKILKQADTLLLFQNIPWAFTAEDQSANYAMYAPLCNQTSSLSFCTHALLAAREGAARDARRYFDLTAGMDLEDSMGNTAHGVHGAGQGGIWLAAVGGFGGLQVGPEGLSLDPRLPEWWIRLQYRFRYRGATLEVDVHPERFVVRNVGGSSVDVRIRDKECTLAPGAEKECAVSSGYWHEQDIAAVVFDPGVLSGAGTGLLDELRDAGIRTAVVDPRVTAAEIRERVPGAIDAAIGSDGMWSAPPDPESWLSATQHVRALPWNCLGLCSTPETAEAAHRAGILAVGINADAAKQADVQLSPDASPSLATLRDLFAANENPVNPYLERNRAIARGEAKED